MFTDLNVMVIGATGGIGSALVQQLCDKDMVGRVHACSRNPDAVMDHKKIASHQLDFKNEQSIEKSVAAATREVPLDLVIVATGLLHNDSGLKPEKTLKNLNADSLAEQYLVNTIGPSLVAKHALPKMNKSRMSLFSAMSARVGSISDNGLGGWYGYRASKSALNMMLKTASIEMKRRNKFCIVIGLHPGTVDTNLSKPFQGNVKEGKLFTPQYSAQKLLDVVFSRKIEDTGKVYAWDGQEIPA